MYEPFDPRRQRLNLKYTSEHVHIFLNPIIQRKYSKIMYLHNHKSYGPVRKRGGGVATKVGNFLEKSKRGRMF